MNESDLEDTCLDWLASFGWHVTHGDDISPGGAHVCRERFSEVVLAPRLREAVVRMNPALPSNQVDQVVAKVTSYGSQSLVDGNREMYDWLRNGVPLSFTVYATTLVRHVMPTVS